jgi:hypothetical protein
MVKTAYRMRAAFDAHVITYTRTAKEAIDIDGQKADLEVILLDDRNFPDRKQQTVLQHVHRQLNAQDAGRGEQTAQGPIRLKEITRHTGMDRDTIIARLRGLAERRIIDLEIREGDNPIYHVGWHLVFSDWQGIRQLDNTLP